MAEARALPDLVSRIRVDSSGIDAAMGSLIQSFGRANLALAGVAAGIGLLVVGGKSMIDIAEKQDKAERGLEQAYAAAGANLNAYRKNIDDFILTNRRYIGDQTEVTDGYAKLTRSGITQTEVQKDMSRAIDLAAIKHISLSEAVDLLDKAEHGRLRGLIDLGIVTKDQTDAEGNLVKGTKTVEDVMTALDPKLKGGRDTLTSLQQHSNQLNNDWQDLSRKGGPVLLTLLDAIVTGVTAVYDWFDRVGKDNNLWAAISDRLVKMASWIKQYVIDPLNAAGTALNTLAQQHASQLTQQTGRYGGVGTGHVNVGRQQGGSVIPGHVYDIGEGGPEKLFMFSGGGGMVIPNSGSGSSSTTHYNLTLNGSSAVNDPEGVRRMLQRMQLLGAGA